MKKVADMIADLMAQELVLMQAYEVLRDLPAVQFHYDELIKLYCVSSTIEKNLEDP